MQSIICHCGNLANKDVSVDLVSVNVGSDRFRLSCGVRGVAGLVGIEGKVIIYGCSHLKNSLWLEA